MTSLPNRISFSASELAGHWPVVKFKRFKCYGCGKMKALSLPDIKVTPNEMLISYSCTACNYQGWRIVRKLGK